MSCRRLEEGLLALGPHTLLFTRGAQLTLEVCSCGSYLHTITTRPSFQNAAGSKERLKRQEEGGLLCPPSPGNFCDSYVFLIWQITEKAPLSTTELLVQEAPWQNR